MKKLKFDSDELRYVKRRRGIGYYLRLTLKLFFLSIFLSGAYYLLFSLIINTKEEKKLLVENRAILEEYENLVDRSKMIEGTLNNLQSRDRGIYKEVFNASPTSFTSHSEDSLKIMDDAEISKDLINYTRDKLFSLNANANSCVKLINEILDSVMTGAEGKNKFIPAITPVPDFTVIRTGASVGRKIHPFYKTLHMHNGLDLLVPVGTNVLATADGVVSRIIASTNNETGNKIEVDHGNGYVTTYSHLSDILVRRGRRVERGDEIGRSGSTGKTFAPHLHYEVIYKGEYRDPINYFFADLNSREYEAMMKKAINTGQSLD